MYTQSLYRCRGLLGVVARVVLLGALTPPVRAQVAFRLGSTGLDYGKAVTADNDGNLYLAAYFENTVDFDASPSAASNLTASSFVDTAFAKYDAGGNLMWVRHLTNTLAGPLQSDIPHGIVPDAQTNLYLAGYFSGTVDFDPGPGTELRSSHGSYDIWTASYDPEGRFRWVHTCGNTNAGNTTQERIYDVAVTPDGEAYTAGYFEGALDLSGLDSAGAQDGLITAYARDGSLRWAFGIGGPTNDQVQAIALDGTGHLFVAGSFRGTVDFDPGSSVSNLVSAGPASDLFLACYTTNAALRWALRVGGPGFEQAAPGGMTVDAEGNLYLTGRFQQTVDFDPGPGTRNLTSNGSDDLFVASFTSGGGLRWAFPAGGTGLDGGHRVRLDSRTNVIVAGWFTGITDFDPGDGAALVTAASANGGSDAFVAAYNPQGLFRWVTTLSPSTAETGNGIAAGLWVDARDRILATGQFFGSSSLTGAGHVIDFFNAGESDAFLLRLDREGWLCGAEISEAKMSPDGLSLLVQAASGHDYAIEVSGDGVAWHTAQTIRANGFLSITQHTDAASQLLRVKAAWW